MRVLVPVAALVAGGGMPRPLGAAPLDAAPMGDAEPPAAAIEEASGATPVDLSPTVLSGLMPELLAILDVASVARERAASRPPADLGTPPLWVSFPATAPPAVLADPAPSVTLAVPMASLPSSTPPSPPGRGGTLPSAAASGDGAASAATAPSTSPLVAQAARLGPAPLLVSAAAPPRLAALGQGPGGGGPPGQGGGDPPGDPCSRRPQGCPPGHVPEPPPAGLGTGVLASLAMVGSLLRRSGRVGRAGPGQRNSTRASSAR